MVPSTSANIGQTRTTSLERTGPLLPDDVLLNICAHITPDNIYALSQGSRHFYNIFFPIYLAKNGVNNISGDVRLSRKKLVVLSVLKTSLMIPTIERLSCEFDYPTERLAERLDDLKGTLLRIGNLPELIVGFSVESPWCNLQQQHSEYSHEYRVKLRKSLQEVMEVAFRTVDTVHVKKGKLMTMLLEDAGSPQLKAFLGSVQLVKTMNNGGKLKSRLSLRSLLPKTKAKKSKGSPSSSSQVQQVSGPSTKTTNTTIFLLHSPIFFGHTVHTWTCDLLSRSTLTHLSIQDINVPPPVFWPTFLPKVTIPTLSRLTVIYDLIPAPALSEFLNRHPSVHYLHIDTSPSGKQKPPPPDKPEKLVFDHVKMLIASPAHLDVLLDSSRSSIPNLEEIGVHIKVEHGCYVAFKLLGELNLVSALNSEPNPASDPNANGNPGAEGANPAPYTGPDTGTDKTPKSAAKPGCIGKPNIDALSITLQLRAESHLMATSWLGFLPSASSSSSPNPTSPASSSSASDANLNIVLARINKIDMDWWQFISPTADIPVIVDWLAIFPSLKVLEFTAVKKVESKPDAWQEVLEAVRKTKPDLEIKEN
ncbi:hypothetical protein BDN72DRAFT_840122 [Pluteus cervinus]|uniref:Uncharacterized protein n=1 Tax=Pluteus cervinus TaxID=181527 RepID=A0ACD3AVQ6_9AGAR|nr:hypothetical protein BDN72DRAFT_840122 [Pluteus cervinus]